MTVIRADAVVIGAGAGGLCAAARLSHAGLHTLVVDDKDRIGGRASTEQIDGFTVNIGAIAIELGGVFEETFNTVGAPLDIRTPEPASSFFIDGKLIDVGRGGWSLLLGQLTKAGLAHPGEIRRRPLRQPSRRTAIDRGLAQDLHQQRLGARDLPQPLRGDLCLQRQRTAGARLPDLFHQQGRLQALWLLPARHDRRLERARRPRSSAMAISGCRRRRCRSTRPTAASKASRSCATVRGCGSIPISSSAMPAPRPPSRSAAKPPSRPPMSSRCATG